jgi:hypothetical protein
VKSVERAGQGRWEVLHRPIPLQPPSRLVLEHVEASPPERLLMREEDDASVFEVEYRLAPAADGGTRFMQVSEFEWKRGPRVLHVLLARGVRRDVCRQLRCLKEALEES